MSRTDPTSRRSPRSPRQTSFSLGSEGESVEGVYSVARVTFHNPETGYAIVQLVPSDAPPDSIATVTAVGTFSAAQEGACYRIEGQWHHDRRYGAQIRATSAIIETPGTPQAVERYLAGASIKGLGPHHARLVVEHFGARVLDELDAGGARLQEVRGIGPVRAGKIQASWAEHRAINRLMVSLQGVAGLTPRQAQRIYREFGESAWQVVSSDPYQLAERVAGFGFQSCDRIAQSLGITSAAPQRLQAGILHVLGQTLGEGHLWTAADEALATASDLLGAEPDVIAPQMTTLVAGGRVIAREIGATQRTLGLYLPAVAEAEQRTCRRLREWLRQPPIGSLRFDAQGAARLISARGQEALTNEQRLAIQALLQGTRLVVLTGGPGTGKTTAVRTLIECLEARSVPYALCATTGRAAKQLAQATGRPAATVHRHMGLGPTASSVAPEPLAESVLIIDEASMIDLWLMDQVVARLSERSHLVLVGDVDQLPPVGPGAMLHDLIEAARELPATQISVIQLTRIFRQEAGEVSLIASNCARIRDGQRPTRPTSASSDYYEMPRESPAEALDLAVQLATERLPGFLNVPPTEIQVLSPVHGGDAGVQALNLALQSRLNPPDVAKAECVLRHRPQGQHEMLRVGDRVRQTRNDYQRGVFNGDLGTVTAIDLEDQLVRVLFDDTTAEYSFAELDDLVHAWAMTVHAAQGSQWPAVIVIMLTAHYVMLERNILYTALSRAQRLAVLITQERALSIALQRTRLVTRRTDTVALLCEGTA